MSNKRPYSPCDDDECPSKIQKIQLSEKSELYMRKAIKNVKQYYEELLTQKNRELQNYKELLAQKDRELQDHKFNQLKLKRDIEKDPPSYIS